MKAAPVLLLRDVLSLIPLLLPFAFLLLPFFRDVRLEARALLVEGDARGDLVGESHPAVRSAAEGLGGARACAGATAPCGPRGRPSPRPREKVRGRPRRVGGIFRADCGSARARPRAARRGGPARPPAGAAAGLERRAPLGTGPRARAASPRRRRPPAPARPRSRRTRAP